MPLAFVLKHMHRVYRLCSKGWLVDNLPLPGGPLFYTIISPFLVSSSSETFLLCAFHWLPPVCPLYYPCLTLSTPHMVTYHCLGFCLPAYAVLLPPIPLALYLHLSHYFHFPFPGTNACVLMRGLRTGPHRIDAVFAPHFLGPMKSPPPWFLGLSSHHLLFSLNL